MATARPERERRVTRTGRRSSTSSPPRPLPLAGARGANRRSGPGRPRATLCLRALDNAGVAAIRSREGFPPPAVGTESPSSAAASSPAGPGSPPPSQRRFATRAPARRGDGGGGRDAAATACPGRLAVRFRPSHPPGPRTLRPRDGLRSASPTVRLSPVLSSRGARCVS